MHLLHRSRQIFRFRAHSWITSLGVLAIGAGCYHPVMTASATPARVGRGTGDDSIAGAQPRMAPHCFDYVLLVENALPSAVEIYEVGHNSNRFVMFAQVGYTEVPMTESTQQFVAMSRGEVMAAATNLESRVGDRVALHRGCRLY